jgi:hypothetical protein
MSLRGILAVEISGVRGMCVGGAVGGCAGVSVDREVGVRVAAKGVRLTVTVEVGNCLTPGVGEAQPAMSNMLANTISCLFMALELNSVLTVRFSRAAKPRRLQYGVGPHSFIAGLLTLKIVATLYQPKPALILVLYHNQVKPIRTVTVGPSG